jgi:hypothetical protein
MLARPALVNIGYYSLGKPLYGKHDVQRCEGYVYFSFLRVTPKIRALSILAAAEKTLPIVREEKHDCRADDGDTTFCVG